MSDARLLRERNQFVAEGRFVVARTIDDGHRVMSVLVNPASCAAIGESLSRLPDEAHVYVCNTADFAPITGFNMHRGCIALVERPADRDPADVMREADLLLVLEGITDADNVGSAFRNAAAFGANVLLSPTCCDPLYRKAVRTSMGSVLRVPYARLASWPRDLHRLKAEGFAIVALTLGPEAFELNACEHRARMALMAGTEGAGLTAGAEAIADLRVRIGIAAAVDSLNVATAVGIALHYFRNRP